MFASLKQPPITDQIVSYISRHITLKAGDIIFTGTPEGVIVGYPKDKQVWLKAGDEIACSVEKLGEPRFGLVRLESPESPGAVRPQPAILKNNRFYTALLFDNICTAG